MAKLDKETQLNGKQLHPESLMMSHAYKPELSEGAIKVPIFQTSTFVFKTAEEGKAFFEVAYGLRKQGPEEEVGLIYSRINNPDLEVLEDRLRLWENAEDCAVFQSGMAAVSTTLLEFLKPGDLLVHSEPLYGGTDHFIKEYLPRLGVKSLGFMADSTAEEVAEMIKASGQAAHVAMFYLETPANPTNALVDIENMSALAKKLASQNKKDVPVVVDNTFLGPLFLHPLKFGADMVIYSATKYIGGHSDLIAGVCLGHHNYLTRVKTLRSFLGTLASPWTGWLLLRSLETLKLRMTSQMKNAQYVADYLVTHPKVEKVYYLDQLAEGSRDHKIYKKHCTAPGAIISFDIRGGEKEAFKFLNSLKLISLAVSLGGTESLAEHPYTMTHAGVDPECKKEYGISEKMIRVSVGVEHPEDIIADLKQAFEQV